jgi:NAD(P)-binding Rossmann-like domain
VETNIYPCVVIGSSPICLIEALYQSKLHEKILIVESDDRIGGSWGTISLFNFADVEIGPHIIYGSCDNRNVYRFMSQFLGISMEPLSPGPVCVVSGRFLGIKKIQVRHHWLQTISAMMDNLNVKKNSSFLELKHFYTRPIIAIIKSLLGFYPEPMYPEKGCPEIVGKLAAMLDASRVEIKLNTRVNSLEVDRCSKTAILHTDNSDIVTSKAIVTSHASLTTVYENGVMPLNLNYQTDEYTLIHLLVRDAQPSTFSYVRFYDHEVLVRIRDLTKYARFDEPSRDLKIICVHIRRGHKFPDDLDAILGFLKTHSYIGREACVVDYKVNDCVDSSLTGKTIEAMGKRYAPVIESLRTDDNLSYAISENLKRWRKHLLVGGSAAGAEPKMLAGGALK